jgi:CRP/FNR family transcriptional regulator, cyclic AMP receptor protein
MEQETNILQHLVKIKNIQIFHWLNETELQKLLLISSILHFKKGETVISQGDVGDALYAVISGKVDVSVKDMNDKHVVICSINQGEVFGEAAIFLLAKRTATVTCACDTTLIQIGRKDLIYFFKVHPHAGNKLLMLIILNLLNKLRHANEDLVLEKQSELDLGDVDSLIQDFISESDQSPE